MGQTNFLQKKTFKIIMIKSLFLHNSSNTINRNTVILPQHVGKIITVHNGKEFVKLAILKEMIYYKLGEFVKTRRINTTKIHNNKTLKRKKK
jgi:ribosomal protein S19